MGHDPDRSGGCSPWTTRPFGIDWGAVWVLYAREVRTALRDRTIVVNGILVPVLLYPFLLWLMFAGITFVRGQTSDMTARVAAFGLEGHPGLRKELEAEPRVVVVAAPSPAAATAAVKEGSLDAVLEVLPPGSGEGSLQVRITFGSSKERSAVAKERMTALLDRSR